MHFSTLTHFFTIAALVGTSIATPTEAARGLIDRDAVSRSLLLNSRDQ